jgi:hypothetical protein
MLQVLLRLPVLAVAALFGHLLMLLLLRLPVLLAVLVLPPVCWLHPPLNNYHRSR